MSGSCASNWRRRLLGQEAQRGGRHQRRDGQHDQEDERAAREHERQHERPRRAGDVEEHRLGGAQREVRPLERALDPVEEAPVLGELPRELDRALHHRGLRHALLRRLVRPRRRGSCT